MDIVQPINIVSPNGVPCLPRIISRRVGRTIVTEAHWIDPLNGVLFKRGTVSIENIIDEEFEDPIEVPQAKVTQFPGDSDWDVDNNLVDDDDVEEENEENEESEESDDSDGDDVDDAEDEEEEFSIPGSFDDFSKRAEAYAKDFLRTGQ